jgi:glycosyltransferase involved in cell wall biosynthesis
MKPLVSVVIPVHNCQAFVAEAVRSALDQDHAPLEVIVVDDGSTDDSVAMLKPFGDAIRLVQVRNGGPARARNKGFELARGEFVAFLDADDVWRPGKLTAQVQHLLDCPDVGICYTDWWVWQPGADGRFERPAHASLPVGRPGPSAERSGWIYSRLLLDCELLTTTVMLRAELARRVGLFDPELAIGEDYDFWLRMSRAARITRLDCVGALYRALPGSASRTARTRNFEFEVVQRAIERFGLSNPDGSGADAQAIEQRLDRLLFQHGYLHLHHGDAAVALHSFGQMLQRHPWRWRLWVHAARALGRRTFTRCRTALAG